MALSKTLLFISTLFVLLLIAACGQGAQKSAPPPIVAVRPTAAEAATPTPLPTPTRRNLDEVKNSWEASKNLDGRHRDIGLTCEKCHNPFPPQSAPADTVCLACHGRGESGVRNITTHYKPNPHDGHYGEIACAFCHKMHEPKIASCAQCHEEVRLVSSAPTKAP
jgi:hypothetical protein